MEARGSFGGSGSQPGALIGRHVGERGVLTALQYANVGDNGPAVTRLDLRRVILHGAETVRNDIVEITYRHGAQAIDVVRRRPAHAALDDHAQARAQTVVTRRAENIETLAAALEDFTRDGQWESRNGIVALFAG